MNILFQGSLLGYLFRDKTAIRYKDQLDSSLFDIPTHQTVFDEWHRYVSKYNSIPNKANFLEFVDREAKRTKGLTQEVYAEILNTIAVVYSKQHDDEYEFTRDVIIEYAQKKRFRNLFTSKASLLATATEKEFEQIYTEVRKIESIGKDLGNDAKNRGGFLFADGDTNNNLITADGHQTFLHALNRMTAAGGFYSPQHILLVGGPKAFKTGTMVSIMTEYARSGLRIFYADAENGLNSIRTRFKQALLECERHEVSTYKSELKEILKRIRVYGGDIATHFFPSGSTLDDVDIELDRLAMECDWHPHIICYDPLYKFQPVNKKIFDTNRKIQDVNAHAAKLNSKYNTFSFTAAKVKADAVNKLILKKNDLGEDFQQNYDAHAVFALCRTESEEADGYGRIVVVSQREGMPYIPGPKGTCAIKINAATNTITELDSEAYLATLEESQAHNKPATRRKYISPNTLKDE